MKTKLLKLTRRLWNYDLAPRHINRSNQLKYARALMALGDRSLVAKQIQRKEFADAYPA